MQNGHPQGWPFCILAPFCNCAETSKSDRIPCVLRCGRADNNRHGWWEMKVSVLCFALLCSAIASHGQGPFPTDEALKQLYHDYDPATKTAQWVCTKEQLSNGMHAGWPCPKEDATVSVSVVLTAQSPEGGITRVYFVTSAKPSQGPEGGYSCHACAPAIGAAIFVWKEQSWEMESANAAIGFWAGWGEPPSVELVAVGPEKHGLLLSSNDESQGFSSSFKQLVIPVGKSVEVVWGIEDESDDADAVDPTDKASSPPPYRSSATTRFLPGRGVAGGTTDYYNIEVVSRGTSWRYGRPVKPENWTEIYVFKNGRYRLLRRTVLAETRSSGKNPSH